MRDEGTPPLSSIVERSDGSLVAASAGAMAIAIGGLATSPIAVTGAMACATTAAQDGAGGRGCGCAMWLGLSGDARYGDFSSPSSSVAESLASSGCVASSSFAGCVVAGGGA